MLELIDLDIESLGWEQFISAWLYRGERGVFLVDPGPAATVGYLVRELKDRGVTRLDRVLLTHIHMDHSGGIGHLLEHFPDARVVCHESAVEHLVDPTRLLEGSKKVLKEIAEVYGDIRPVSASQIDTGPFVDFEDGIRVIPAPGHAPHHQCFVFQDLLFCGELFGVFQKTEEGCYLRPATPPRFVPEAFFGSMDSISPYASRKLCFGHYGSYPDGREILQMSKKQLTVWMDVIRSHVEAPNTNLIIKDLEEKDPVFSRINCLSASQYNRELYFCGNSVKGILLYLNEK